MPGSKAVLNVHIFGVNMATVALLGNLNIDRNVFDTVAAEFDLRVEQVQTLRALREKSASRNVAAVLFSARTLGVSWNEALQSVLAAAPGALPVVCPGFSEAIRWPELADAGAFHELHLPIDESEARHSLGFIWAARRGENEQTRVGPQRASNADSGEIRFAAKN